MRMSRDGRGSGFLSVMYTWFQVEITSKNDSLLTHRAAESAHFWSDGSYSADVLRVHPAKGFRAARLGCGCVFDDHGRGTSGDDWREVVPFAGNARRIFC